MKKKELDKIRSFVSVCPECDKVGDIVFSDDHRYDSMSMILKCRDNLCGNRWSVSMKKR